jgi:hypothetical protein
MILEALRPAAPCFNHAEHALRDRSVKVAPPSDANAPAAERARWADAAARNGWQGYPQAGERCFRPDKNLFGIAGLTSFNVACPPLALSVADQRRWVAFTANHGWAAYPQAGAGCVDP